MEKTKILVVTHYEHVGTFTDGRALTEKIEETLQDYPSDEWVVRSATTSIVVSGDDGEFRPNTTYSTTVILDRK